MCKRKCSTRHETCWSAKNFRWIAQQTTVWALQSWNTERDFFFFLDFTLMRRFWFGGSELFILTYSASPGGVKKSPVCRCLFCVSHEGSFINDRVAGFGLWSIHFCIWRQMRLKRYTWGKAESMEKKKNSPDSGGNLWPQSLLLLSSDGFRVINWLHMLWCMGVIN